MYNNNNNNNYNVLPLSDCTDVQAHLGPVVQSIISLTSSLVVKILTVLESTSNSQVFFAE